MMTDEINTDELHALTWSDTKELAGMYMAMQESGRQHALALLGVVTSPPAFETKTGGCSQSFACPAPVRKTSRKRDEYPEKA